MTGHQEIWCQPGDATKRQFIVFFDDPSQDIATFDDEDEARAFWERASIDWNCYLLGTLPRIRNVTPLYLHPPLSHRGEDSAEVERLRGLLSRAEEYVIDGVTNAKAEAEMNAPYPARAHRYDAALAEVRQLYADIQAALAATRSGSATTAKGCAE